jgi:hypothetical protein
MTIKKIVEIVETALSVRAPLISATRTQTGVTRHHNTMVFANSSRRKSVASSSAAVARSGSGFEHSPITSKKFLKFEPSLSYRSKFQMVHNFVPHSTSRPYR